MRRNVPTISIRSNTLMQIQEALDEVLAGRSGEGVIDDQLDGDVAEAIEFVKTKGKPFELDPKPGNVRKQ